jgi:membrane-associated phospholipid phosphatase
MRKTGRGRRYPGVMHKGGWRFAVAVAAALAVATLVVAWVYDLPVRDPDSVAGPTYLRLPAILLAAFLVDVLPRTLWRTRSPLNLHQHFTDVVRERWTMANVRFALVGLGAWYVTYAAFRNLKSFVPFVNRHLWDGVLEDIDRIMWFGHDPAEVLHSWLGTGFAAHFLSFIYVAWIVMVPASLVVALVWSRDTRAGSWYVTAIAVDWVLGVATYFALPTLGPIYAAPAMFSDLARTDVTGLQETMMLERHEVLVNPFTTDAVQTIAAFASLHVGISVSMCVMAELLRLHRGVRLFLWVFLALTVVATVYLGWHYFVDAIGGAVLGVAGAWIAAKGTGHAFRRRSALDQPALSSPSASRPA